MFWRFSNRRVNLPDLYSFCYRVLLFVLIAKMRGFENQPQKIVYKNYAECDSNPCSYHPVTSTGFEFAAALPVGHAWNHSAVVTQRWTVDANTLGVGTCKLTTQRVRTALSVILAARQQNWAEDITSILY